MKGQKKSEGVATVLAALVGMFLIYGVGHIYVGRIGRGLIILFIELAIGVLVVIPLVYGLAEGEVGFIIPIAILLLADLILWIWQIFDARRVCRDHNRNLEQVD